MVHVRVPVAVLPASRLLTKPLNLAPMSACKAMPRGTVWALLAVTSSCVRLPAVVEMLSAPPLGVMKVLLQLMLSPMAKVLGSGLGVQL